MTDYYSISSRNMPTFSTATFVVLSGFAAVTSAFRFPYGPEGAPVVDLGYEVYSAASFNVSIIMMTTIIIMKNMILIKIYAYL